MKLIVLIFIFFSPNILFSQKEASPRAKLAALQKMLASNPPTPIHKALNAFEQNELPKLTPNSIEQQIYHSIKANYLGLEESYAEAILHIRKALQIAKLYSDSIQPSIYTHWVARSSYEQIGHYDKAIKQGKKLIVFYNKDRLNQTLELANNYQKIGIFYKEKTQTNRAIEYFNKALAIYQNSPQTTPLHLARLYRSFSMGYFKAGDYTQQLHYIKKALVICKKDSSHTSRRLEISLLNNLAGHYLQVGQTDQGLSIYHEYIAATTKEHGAISTITAMAYMNLAIAYAQLNDLATSETYFRKSIAIKTRIFGSHNPNVALAYGNLTILLNMMGRHDDALIASQQSFIANTLNYKDTTPLVDLLPIIAKYKILDPINAIGNLNNRTMAFQHLYKKNKDIANLKHAHQTVLAQIAILDQAKNKLSDQDKLKILNKNFMPFTIGIKLAHQLYELTQDRKYLEDGFQLAERSRDATLTSALSSKRALNFGGIPDSLIQKENQLKKAISKLDKKILEVNKKRKPPYELQEALFAKKRALEVLIQKLEKDYPLYYQLKYKNHIASVQEIQQIILDQQATLIAYYIQFPDVYIWSATQQTANFQRIQLDSNYTKDIQAFRKVLTDLKYVQANATIANQTYDKLSHKFYTTLLKPVLQNSSNEHLIIIPDHLLGHLPFEAFTASIKEDHSVDYQHKNYLIHDYEIQYSYSGTLLLQNKQQYDTQAKQVELLAVAADYKNKVVTQKNRSEEDLMFRRNLKPLPAAVNEVKALEKVTKGIFLYDQQANETLFKKHLPHYGLIHLAMHGILNKKNPIASSLAFTEDGAQTEDNFLHAFEISNLPLNAQLVVLSACETGFGKFEKGEGIMSLARSFMHAGVPSLVVSLWQVNDYSTSEIMRFFYTELKKGKSKSAALRSAKLTYLKQRNGIAAHPALWAPFIQLGNQEPLTLSAFQLFSFVNGLLLLFFGIIIVFLARLFLRKKV
ncbi:CHAT domain-containing protein [Aureispira anguillae]|uniref:CHAT domain-containing protein n=1 Tax=Aureispira anguillae TaxID=2864201 RepID=A0A915YCV7_9BACT|nr:CHAT domain-containing protein [Aureispira anguillae]BDS10760.1 CHAT domain-containing protein [Aureispira anguillae]